MDYINTLVQTEFSNFPKRYNINTNGSKGMPERKPKMKTGMKTLFKRPFQSSTQMQSFISPPQNV